MTIFRLLLLPALLLPALVLPGQSLPRHTFHLGLGPTLSTFAHNLVDPRVPGNFTLQPGFTVGAGYSVRLGQRFGLELQANYARLGARADDINLIEMAGSGGYYDTVAIHRIDMRAHPVQLQVPLLFQYAPGHRQRLKLKLGADIKFYIPSPVDESRTTTRIGYPVNQGTFVSVESYSPPRISSHTARNTEYMDGDIALLAAVQWKPLLRNLPLAFELSLNEGLYGYRYGYRLRTVALRVNYQWFR